MSLPADVIRLLEDAYQATKKPDGWAYLADVGTSVQAITPACKLLNRQ
jgi:hypothetical protein